MNPAVVVASVVSLLAILAVVVAIFASVPRSVTLFLTSDDYIDRQITVELGRRRPNGKYDYDRRDRKRFRFVGRTREVTFSGLVPGAWYRVDTLPGSGYKASRTIVKAGSTLEIRLVRD
jgi:hypothetical protein